MSTDSPRDSVLRDMVATRDAADLVESCRRSAADVRLTVARARRLTAQTRSLLAGYAERPVSPHFTREDPD